jgi:hypothetical protein
MSVSESRVGLVTSLRSRKLLNFPPIPDAIPEGFPGGSQAVPSDFRAGSQDVSRSSSQDPIPEARPRATFQRTPKPSSWTSSRDDVRTRLLRLCRKVANRPIGRIATFRDFSESARNCHPRDGVLEHRFRDFCQTARKSLSRDSDF